MVYLVKFSHAGQVCGNRNHAPCPLNGNGPSQFINVDALQSVKTCILKTCIFNYSHIFCRNPFTQFSFISSYLLSSTRPRSRPSFFQSSYTPLSYLISASSISHLLYVDDTQRFISFVPKNFSSAINNHQTTITLISSWMSSNYLNLNSSKTEFLLIGLPQQTSKIAIAIYDLERPYKNPQLSGDALHGKLSGKLTAIGNRQFTVVRNKSKIQ